MAEWTLTEARLLCAAIEAIAPEFNAHVALTGGTLYKDGPRKDVDILFYAIRREEIDVAGLLRAIEYRLNILSAVDYGWVVKAILGDSGKEIDFFFPERNYDKYPAADLADDSEYSQ